MKYWFFKFACCFCFVVNSVMLFSQDFFVISDKGLLYKVDLADCSLKPRNTGTSSLVYGDITYHPNGNFYAITKNTLYSIDTFSGTTQSVKTFNTGLSALNAMTTDLKGLIYITSEAGELITYDLKTKVEKSLGRIGINGKFFQGSTGDLTFYKGELYMVAGSDLIRVSLSNPQYCPIVLSFPPSIPVFGLVGFADCKGIRTFAITSQKPSSVIYEIDWATNSYHKICSIGTTVFGAASKYDLFASLASPDSVYRYEPTCFVSKIGTIERKVYTSSRGCDSVVRTEFTRRIDTVTRYQYLCQNGNSKLDTFYQVKPGSCDSLIILKTENAPRSNDKTLVDVPVCEGNYFLVGSSKITKDGSYPVVYKNIFGCDSTVTYKVKVNAKRLDTTLVSTTICYGDSLKFGSVGLRTEGIFARTVNNILGCDSTIIVRLNVWKRDTFFFFRTTCDSTKAKKIANLYINEFGCDSIAVVDTRFLPNPPRLHIDLPDRFKIKVGDSVLITPNLNFIPEKVKWLDMENVSCSKCINTFAKPLFPTQLVFMAFDSSDCFTQAKTTIDVDRTRQVFIPNVFSPNGDAINDTFKIHSDNTITEVIDFKVFNRSGVLFYETNHTIPDNGWDGTIKGSIAPNDVYMYYFKVRFKEGGTEEYFGDVSLIR